MRRLLRIFAIFYAVVGFVLGGLLSSAIPAMNVLGVAYYALTWPAFVCHGVKVCSWSPPIPGWAFSFKGPLLMPN